MNVEDDRTIDVRPVSIGHSFRRLITRALYKTYMPMFNDAMKPTQYAVGEKGGITQHLFGLRAIIDQNPNSVIISVDVRNNFNEVSRKSILQSLWSEPSLRPLFYFTYKSLMCQSYMGMGSGTNITDADFLSCEGVQQGTVDAPPLACIAFNSVYNATNTLLQQHGGSFSAIIDDCTLTGPLATTLDALQVHERNLAAIGMTLNRSKTFVYLPQHLRTNDNIQLCQQHHIQLGTILSQDNQRHYGLKIGGIPFGDPSYISTFLHNKFLQIQSDCTTIMDSLNPDNNPHPSIPCLQTLWVVLTRSIQHRGSYWTRHLFPSLTLEFTKNLNGLINDIAKKATSIDFSTASPIIKTRLRLPTTLQGAGLRCQVFRRHIDFIGGLCHGIPPLFHRQDSNGNILPGRMPSPSITNLFGPTSFNTPTTSPWQHLLNHPQNPFAIALTDCYNAITSAFRNTQQNLPPKHLANIPITSLGCNHSNTFLPSPTSALSKILEQEQAMCLRQQLIDQTRSSTYNTMERLASLHCDSYSTAIFVALPRKGTFFTNREFTESVRTIFGLPSPIFSNLTGQFISNRQEPSMIDPHGINVANASLPGDGFRHRHDIGLKFVLRDIIRSTKKTCMVECRSMFNGKIDSAIYYQYSLHNTDPIIPDLLVPNYEHSLDLLGEVKIYGIHRNNKNYPINNTRMVDRASSQVIKSYQRKTKQLDDLYYPNNPSNTPGPFSNTLSSFHNGGVTPFVAGAFAECNKQIDDLLKHCSLHAAATREGILLTPDTDLTHLYSTRNILLHEFRTTVGCSVLRANTNHKLQRLHYIRPSPNAATSTAAIQRSNNRLPRPLFNDPHSWFSNTGDDGVYDEYYRYRNLKPQAGDLSPPEDLSAYNFVL